MATLRGARRYAQAAFEVAVVRGDLDRWQADLDDMAQVLLEPSIGALLDNPRVPLADKTRLVRQALGRTSPQVQNLACLLVAERRRETAGRVSAEFNAMVDAHRGILRARVTSASPLEGADEQRIAEGLASLLGREVRVETRVDSGIIGGFVARVGDVLIDGSVRSQLEAMKVALAGPRG